MNYEETLKYFEVHHWPHGKKRLGKDGDGGYVICNIPSASYDVFVSGGICEDVSFEEDFLSLYQLPTFAFDPSIDSLPTQVRGKDVQYAKDIKFFKKSIGYQNNETETNLTDLIKNYKNVFMKVDIEGGEYGLVEALTQADLFQNVTQFVVEIHPTSFSLVHRFLESISKTHVLFHVHANNAMNAAYSINGVPVPCLIELTFVNKNVIDWTLEKNKVNFPCEIDQPNFSDRREALLNYYPFVH
jgi:hypothetical protein